MLRKIIIYTAVSTALIAGSAAIFGGSIAGDGPILSAGGDRGGNAWAYSGSDRRDGNDGRKGRDHDDDD